MCVCLLLKYGPFGAALPGQTAVCVFSSLTFDPLGSVRGAASFPSPSNFTAEFLISFKAIKFIGQFIFSCFVAFCFLLARYLCHRLFCWCCCWSKDTRESFVVIYKSSLSTFFFLLLSGVVDSWGPQLLASSYLSS